MSEHMRDGLEHIIKVCRMARTQSRRTRWIESRARSAINGDDDWRHADIPKHAPDYKQQRDELLAALDLCKFDSLNMSLSDLEFIRNTVAKIKGGE